jgi:hypothetical protein
VSKKAMSERPKEYRIGLKPGDGTMDPVYGRYRLQYSIDGREVSKEEFEREIAASEVQP